MQRKRSQLMCYLFSYIYIHSAGVGRTGTFIAIDSLVEQMETEQVVDVYGFVAQMRKQRNFMVKTKVRRKSLIR